MNSRISFGDAADAAPLDQSKHVQFVEGMVLGVDDFQQEFAWHSGRHQTIARELAGYGTVSGLAVSRDPEAPTVIIVETGLALTPSGQFVRVKRRQCANVAEWLARPENQSELARFEETFGSPPERGVRVYVRLRYRECLADPVPIPGEPCRTEEEAMAASRVADSWRLELGFEPPPQYEADAIHELVHWLRRIRLVDHGAAGPEQVVQHLREAAAELLDSDIRPGHLELGDPPADLFVGREALCACVQAALRFWTTELRPRVQAHAREYPCGCNDAAGGSPPMSGSPPTPADSEEDVLLAELWVPVRDAAFSRLEFDPGRAIRINEDGRPYLLNLRLIQELVTCGPDLTGVLALAQFGSVLATTDESLLLWIHHPAEVDLSAPYALAVAVNGTDAAFRVEPVLYAPNVFEIQIDASPPPALQHGDRITLSFHVDAVTEVASGHTLRDALDRSVGSYLDLREDTITLHAIVAALELDDLVDVDTTGSAEGNVLTFQEGQWRPHAQRLDDLDDVTASYPRDGEVLAFEGSEWAPKALTLGDLFDVTPAQPGYGGEASLDEGKVLTFVEGEWRPESVPRTLDDLDGVSASEPVDGDVLAHQNGEWTPRTLALGDLSDVMPAEPGYGEGGASNDAGKVLGFDGEEWKPTALALGGLSDVTSAEPGDDENPSVDEGKALTFINGGWRPESVPRALGDLSDVTPAQPGHGDPSADAGSVLGFNGFEWFPQKLALGNLRDVRVPEREDSEGWEPSEFPSDGSVLTYQDKRWRARPPSLGSHTHGLSQLDDVEVGGARPGDVLQLDDRGRWVPGRSQTGNTGLVECKIEQGQPIKLFGPVVHGFGKQHVMIRLAFELEKLVLSEDTAADLLKGAVPRMVAVYETGAEDFKILLEDTRGGQGSSAVIIRWYAIPCTETTSRPQPLGTLELDVRLRQIP